MAAAGDAAAAAAAAAAASGLGDVGDGGGSLFDPSSWRLRHAPRPPDSVADFWGLVVFRLYARYWRVIGVSFTLSYVFYALTYVCMRRTARWRRWDWPTRAEMLTRVSSTVHAIVVVVPAAYSTVYDTALADDAVFGVRVPNVAAYTFAISVGYFFADLLMICYFGVQPLAPIVVHHVLAGYGFMSGLGPYMQLSWFGMGLLVTEATTPFNNADWMLTKFGRGRARSTRLLRLAYVFAWAAFRIAPFPFLWYRWYQHRDDTAMASINFRGILFANMLWLNLMNSVYFVTGPFYAYFRDGCAALAGQPPRATSATAYSGGGGGGKQQQQQKRQQTPQKRGGAKRS